MAEGRARPDEERIREFVSHDFARLAAVLTLICGSRAISEEVVQEALARAWEKQLQGEQIDSLAAWVTTVAMNLARSRRRRFLVEMRARQRVSPSSCRRPGGCVGGAPGPVGGDQTAAHEPARSHRPSLLHRS